MNLRKFNVFVSPQKKPLRMTGLCLEAVSYGHFKKETVKMKGTKPSQDKVHGHISMHSGEYQHVIQYGRAAFEGHSPKYGIYIHV